MNERDTEAGRKGVEVGEGDADKEEQRDRGGQEEEERGEAKESLTDGVGKQVCACPHSNLGIDAERPREKCTWRDTERRQVDGGRDPVIEPLQPVFNLFQEEYVIV